MSMRKKKIKYWILAFDSKGRFITANKDNGLLFTMKQIRMNNRILFVSNKGFEELLLKQARTFKKINYKNSLPYNIRLKNFMGQLDSNKLLILNPLIDPSI